MELVVERSRAAIDAGQRITVHGDFDVDGVCATALMVSTLRELGADCDWFIPSRLEDGYGLSEENVRRLAERGTSLLLTVDCGITCGGGGAGAASWGWRSWSPTITSRGGAAGLSDPASAGERLPVQSLCGTRSPGSWLVLCVRGGRR